MPPKDTDTKTPAQIAEEERIAREKAARTGAPADGGSFFDMIGEFLKMIFSMLFGNEEGKDDAPDGEEPDAKPLSLGDKLKIGKFLIQENVVGKMKAYREAHKGEVVTIKSPVAGDCLVKDGFGHREASVKGASENHRGIDMGARGDDTVLAAANGIVICSGKYGTAGNTLIIALPDGRYTVYMHLRDNSGMPKVGAEVEQGEKIGVMGNTSTLGIAKHLHFEVHDQNGKAIKPEIEGKQIAKGDWVKGQGIGEKTYAAFINHQYLPKLPVADTHVAGGPGAGGYKAPGSKQLGA